MTGLLGRQEEGAGDELEDVDASRRARSGSTPVSAAMASPSSTAKVRRRPTGRRQSRRPRGTGSRKVAERRLPEALLDLDEALFAQRPGPSGRRRRARTRPRRRSEAVSHRRSRAAACERWAGARTSNAARNSSNSALRAQVLDGGEHQVLLGGKVVHLGPAGHAGPPHHLSGRGPRPTAGHQALDGRVEQLGPRRHAPPGVDAAHAEESARSPTNSQDCLLYVLTSCCSSSGRRQGFTVPVESGPVGELPIQPPRLSAKCSPGTLDRGPTVRAASHPADRDHPSVGEEVPRPLVGTDVV